MVQLLPGDLDFLLQAFPFGRHLFCCRGICLAGVCTTFDTLCELRFEVRLLSLELRFGGGEFFLQLGDRSVFRLKPLLPLGTTSL